MKIMLLTEQHPEADTPEKRHALIETELGYTSEEMQEMYNYWDEHTKIRRIQAVSRQVKKSNKEKAMKQKSKRREQRKQRKKNHKR